MRRVSFDNSASDGLFQANPTQRLAISHRPTQTRNEFYRFTLVKNGDRLSNPAERGVPIGSYRDKMGALDGRNKLAYFCHQVLPIALLSDSRLDKYCLFYPVDPVNPVR